MLVVKCFWYFLQIFIMQTFPLPAAHLSAVVVHCLMLLFPRVTYRPGLSPYATPVPLGLLNPPGCVWRSCQQLLHPKSSGTCNKCHAVRSAVSTPQTLHGQRRDDRVVSPRSISTALSFCSPPSINPGLLTCVMILV